MTSPTLKNSPLDRWRRCLGGRRRRANPRPLAALGYLAGGPVIDGLVEIDRLTTVILYDEPIRPGYCALRLAGYSSSRIPWGVRFGGPEQCRFLKDLSLQPVSGAQGYRLDLASDELLVLGLQLERELDRHARYRQRHVRKRPRLPKLWAGFLPADSASITGDGPELAAYAARTGRLPQRLLKHLRRDRFGLALYPLAWVSHHWQQAVAVFADLGRFPKRQVFRLRQLPDDLVGYQDAAEFNFRDSRLRQRRRRRPSRRPPAVPAAG
ncbi:MAG: hypothetical protein ABIK89_05790 [Planctomycetota bacterium]